MPYHLLTGATGLLGSYLLRDGLRAGRRMVVLARPSKHESAKQRVETILARWEQELGRKLPRPVVLKGDLGQVDLDLDSPSMSWISQHCDSLIHNAASLTFQGSDRNGEPWQSNVGGTRRVLELCRVTGIRKFHHVSTAYVCGLREGHILESELDVGQEMGNDYERSKVEAEKVVRAADFLDTTTFYRPSIIVGDSRTGYTPTFHGFYAPLKLAHAMVSKVVLGATGGRSLMAQLGLFGPERKNFVPVDWISAVMTHVLAHPEYHGKTYHLTSPHPTPVAEMTAVIQDAVERYSTLADPSDDFRCDGMWFEETFRAELDIYRSYWRDDPRFDQTNVNAAAPHLPCPAVDRTMLMRTARYAIRTNFGRPRPRPVKPRFDVHRHIQRLLEVGYDASGASGNGNGNGARLGLQVNGPGGGQWELMLKDHELVAAKYGLSAKSTATFHLNSDTFRALALRRFPVRQAVESGDVRIEGNGLEQHRLEAILQAAALGGEKDSPTGSSAG